MKQLIFIFTILGSIYSMGLDNIVIADKSGSSINTEFTSSAEKSGSSNILWFEKKTATSYFLMYSFHQPVAGFQFNLTDSDDSDNLVVSGGAAEANGFSVSTGNGVILGFSFKGATIPAGRGVLVELTFEKEQRDISAIQKPELKETKEDPSQNLLQKDIDITQIVVSDPNGQSVSIDYKCHKDKCKDFHYDVAIKHPSLSYIKS